MKFRIGDFRLRIVWWLGRWMWLALSGWVELFLKAGADNSRFAGRIRGNRGRVRGENLPRRVSCRRRNTHQPRCHQRSYGPSGLAVFPHGQRGALPTKFNARGLISRRLGRKWAFFAPFIALNHLDFSRLTEKVAKIFVMVLEWQLFHCSRSAGAELPDGNHRTWRDSRIYSAQVVDIADAFGWRIGWARRLREGCGRGRLESEVVLCRGRPTRGPVDRVELEALYQAGR